MKVKGYDYIMDTPLVWVWALRRETGHIVRATPHNPTLLADSVACQFDDRQHWPTRRTSGRHQPEVRHGMLADSVGIPVTLADMSVDESNVKTTTHNFSRQCWSVWRGPKRDDHLVRGDQT